MSKYFRIPGRLAAKLKASGILVSTVLANAGLPPGLLEQPRMMVTTEELFAFWQAVAQVSGDPAIGLKLGTEAKVEHFDPVALAGLFTESFGEGMRQVARHKRISCPEEIVLETDGVEASIQFRWLLADAPEPHVVTDLVFAWILSIARHGTGGPVSPIRLEVVRPYAHQKLLERHFGCPIHFEAKRNALVFRASDLALPFVTRNAELLAMLAPQLDEELKQQRGEESFSELVRATIQRRLTGRRPMMKEIARELHISSRTLQRRLQDDGYSFQQVLERARHQLARHYLNNPLLGLNEAAFLLGYEDSNSFVRAFRVWEGVPPAHWREAQRAKGV